MSYGISVPAYDLPDHKQPLMKRADFAAEAAKVIEGYHAYDNNPELAAAVKKHMLTGAEAASTVLSVLKGEYFSVTISGHVHSPGDSPDWQTVSVNVVTPPAAEEVQAAQEAVAGS